MDIPFITHTRRGRYDRQEPIIGRSGQKRLGKSRIAIVGVGSLGSMAAQSLVRSGVGQVTVVDRDIVEVENLHAQFIYTEKDIGQPKSTMAKKRLSLINPEIKIIAKTLDLTPDTVDEALSHKDLIIDCTDNLPTRFLINDYCRKKKVAWVHANAIRDVGSAILFTQEKDAPCFRCIYDEKRSSETCETAGVMNTTTAAVGAIASHLALAHLLGKPTQKSMLRIDLASLTITSYSVQRNTQCPVCRDKSFATLEEKKPATVKLCGTSCYQITGKKKDLKRLKERLERYGKVDDFAICLRFKELTVFDDGRVLIKTDSKEEAQALYDKYVAP